MWPRAKKKDNKISWITGLKYCRMLDRQICQNLSSAALSQPGKWAKSKHRYPGYTNHDILNSQVATSMFDLWSQFIYNSAQRETLCAIITSQGQMPCSIQPDNMTDLKKRHPSVYAMESNTGTVAPVRCFYSNKTLLYIIKEQITCAWSVFTAPFTQQQFLLNCKYNLLK